MPQDKFGWKENDLEVVHIPRKLTPEEYEEIKEQQKDKTGFSHEVFKDQAE